MNNEVVNILIAEPSLILYEGLSNILGRSGSQFRLFKVDELSDIQQLQLKTNINLVIINPSLIQNQVKAFSSIRKEMNDTKWLGLIYTHFDKQLIDLLDGCFSINDSPAAVINSIQKALNTNQHSEQHQSESLSDRETDVLKLLVTGHSNKEIADKLFISIHTVITHRKNISQKTGIKTVSGLTIYAVVNNIISLEQ